MKQFGYSLLELLVALSIVTILLLLAVPSWQNWIIYHQEKIYVNQIVSALRFARAQAILNNTNVIYCASDDGQNCGDQWSEGQIIETTNNQRLRVFSSLPQTLHLKWQGSFALDNFIQFSAAGFTKEQQGSFYLCGKPHSSGFRIRVVRSGRAAVEDYSCL